MKKRHDLNGRKVEVKKAVAKEQMDGKICSFMPLPTYWVDVSVENQRVTEFLKYFFYCSEII